VGAGVVGNHDSTERRCHISMKQGRILSMRPLAGQRWSPQSVSYHHVYNGVFRWLLLREETTHTKNVRLAGLSVHIRDVGGQHLNCLEVVELTCLRCIRYKWR
jgi:hypothetical protein